MKKIVLLLSVVLILVQNGFAYSDEKFEKLIADAPNTYWRQAYKCDYFASNHYRTGDVNECLKSIELIEKNPQSKLYNNKQLGIKYFNAGVLYYLSAKNYLKAYEYWKIAKNLGNISAKKNLNLLCRKHSWVCENKFSYSDIEFDNLIKDQEEKNKQVMVCLKMAFNHLDKADVNDCLKAINFVKKKKYNYTKREKFFILLGATEGAGDIYYYQGKKSKAYQYWNKAAKVGNTGVKQKINDLCKDSPKVCK